MFNVKEMEGCHSCIYEEQFNTETEPCKSCFGLSHYKNKYENRESNEKAE